MDTRTRNYITQHACTRGKIDSKRAANAFLSFYGWKKSNCMSELDGIELLSCI